MSNDILNQLKGRNRPIVPSRGHSLVDPSPRQEPPTPQPEEQPVPPEEPLVSSHIRLEESLDQGLRDLCGEKKVTKETLLGAAYLLGQSDPEFRERWIQLAKDMRKQRARRGQVKRARSLLKNLEEEI